MTLLTRREFLRVSALSACSLAISTGLSACGSSASDDGVKVSFNHGVASGDPLQDKVIIWTRVTPDFSESSDSLSVSYEVATMPDFSDIIHDGSVTTSSVQDYTVKIDIQNLDSGTKYYYRFHANGKTSDTGIMKTLPSGAVSQVKMAVFTCANYPNGYFNAYDMASKIDDLDVAIHVGDYIYEYGMYENDDFEKKIPAYATKNAVKIGRELPKNNNTECISLNDYRKRYALYHTDEGLQNIHKACPMIAVWDDHEIANDAYKNGAQNHDASEGDYQARVVAALQAYFEWIPIRPIADKKEIYRSFEFGDLVSLNMLETRLGRDKQLDYGDYSSKNGDFDAQKFMADISSTERGMMGAKELDWLQKQMASSNAIWTVLGQQVLMGRMNLPAEVLTPIGMLENPATYGTTADALKTQINASLQELASIKMRILQGDTSVTDDEKTRLYTVLPYNLDAWDGYPYQREVILGTAKAFDKNLIVLAGDTHNSWSNDLKDKDGNQIGVEFATTSVTSPGLEEYLGLTSSKEAKDLENVLTLLIDDLKYANIYDRGFMEVVFTPEAAFSNWHHIDNYDSAEYDENMARIKHLKCLPGSRNRKLIKL